MRSARLDRSIIIERETVTLDGYGVPASTWATVATLRAELVDPIATEVVRDHGASTVTRLTFSTRFVPGITAADRVTYSAATFNIVGLKEVGRRRALEITVERLGP